VRGERWREWVFLIKEENLENRISSKIIHSAFEKNNIIYASYELLLYDVGNLTKGSILQKQKPL